MSIKTFFEEAAAKIASFIAHILPSSKHLLDIALVVVNNLKDFVDSPAADVVTAIIPGTLDDQIKDFLRAKLPVVLTDLKLVDAAAGLSEADILKTGAAVIQSMPDKAKSVTLQGIWQLLSDEITQEAITLPDLQKIGQTYYEASKS